MVKINLLDIPEDQREQGDQSNLSDISPRQSDMDFSFFQPDEDSTIEVRPVEQQSYQAPSPPTPPPAPEPEPPKAAPQGPYLVQETFSDNYESPTDFEDSGRTRKILIGLGIILVVAIVLAASWFLLKSSGNDVNPNVGNTTQPTNTIDPATTIDPEPVVPPEVRDRYTSNLRQNLSQLNAASQILSATTASTGYQMAVILPDHALVSVLGNSLEDFPAFHRSLKDRLPGIQISSKGQQPKRVNGSSKLQVDYQLTVPESRRGANAGTPDFSDTPGDLTNMVRSVAQSNRVRIANIRKGERLREGRLRKTHYYLSVSGSNSALISFLEALAKARPSLRYAKIRLAAARPDQTFGQGTVSGTIDLSDYSQ